MRKAIAVLSLFTAWPLTALAEPQNVYEPLAFLTGHCWQGTMPNGKDTDRHCFTWIYGQNFVRDQHVVNGPGHPDYLGESIYYWNSTTNHLEYLYIESAGGHSQGSAETAADALVFPPTKYTENGKTQVYRSRWQKVNADAYDVVTEFQTADGWRPGFSVHMKKVVKETH